MNIPTGFALPLSAQDNRRQPDRLYQYVLRCNDWPPSEKTAYIQKISEETQSLCKRTCDDNLSIIQATQENDDDFQQLFTFNPYQGTILSWHA
ncbi:10439_t:CDS:2 [Cetraspora pellucida]|uniref:10439_t:CDS:1 n=1 Tax=Cetraspora pellucida TaxID=1433469 RepID=A0ACA9N5B4_9GLOM|nr:10439_t:CDS:2 [Cetraspora pellucida]